MWETWVQSLGREDPLEKGMATHSSILAWRIPWTEEPGGLQSMGSQRVREDWVTDTHIYKQRVSAKIKNMWARLLGQFLGNRLRWKFTGRALGSSAYEVWMDAGGAEGGRDAGAAAAESSAHDGPRAGWFSEWS